MHLSKELRSKNIAEYILYMFHIEDLVRALGMNDEKIGSYVSAAYNSSDSESATEWLKSIGEMIKYENVTERGHILIVKNQIDNLEDFLIRLRNNEDEEFDNIYNEVSVLFDEIRSRSNNGKNTGSAEMALNIMYWFMSQKLAGNEISSEQVDQVKKISAFLAALSLRFRKYESGEYELL